jgi:hypothetical protein
MHISFYFNSQEGAPSRFFKPPRKPVLKKLPSNDNNNNDAVLRSVVDIMTNDLYNMIEF